MPAGGEGRVARACPMRLVSSQPARRSGRSRWEDAWISGGTATIESKTNFLRPVRDGHVEAVARPLHVGRTVIVVDTELRDAAGRLVARTTQTQAVLPAAAP